jgi:hypothetical protein
MDAGELIGKALGLGMTTLVIVVLWLIVHALGWDRQDEPVD